MDKPTIPAQRFLAGQVLLAVFAHIAGDFYAAFYGSLVPFLTAKLNLSLVAVGVLAAFQTTTANFMQPVIGHLEETLGRKQLIAGGILCAAIGMSLLARANSFVSLSLLLLVGGLGVGSFHPCGASMVAEAGGTRRATAISLYFFGGNAGVMLAPLIVPVLAETRPQVLPLLAVPGMLAAVICWGALRGKGRRRQNLERSKQRASLWEVFKKVHPICVHVVLRFIPIMAFTVLLVLYGTLRGMTPVQGGWLLALFLGIGAIGMLAGGHLCDCFPRKSIMVVTELGAGIMLMVVPGLTGVSFFVVLAIGTFLAYIAMPLQAVMAQERVPGSESSASGLVMGFAYGVSTLLLAPLGWLGDYWTELNGSKLAGVSFELRVSAVFLCAAGILAFFLSPHRNTISEPGRSNS